VIAPAKTGSDKRRRTAVIITDHENKEIFIQVILLRRILKIVVIKLIAPKIEEAPAKCKEKIDKSTELPECLRLSDKGGYTVHPVPTPDSTKLLKIKKTREGGRSQKLKLFIRGKAISGPPNIKGINQFPNPPIRIGITIKKIIIKACAVTMTLKIWSSPIKLPGLDSSTRIKTLIDKPSIPAQSPNKK